MSNTEFSVIRWQKAGRESVRMEMLDEEPLSIRIQGRPYAVIMRTPGDELAHAAGFCLAEGLADAPEDIVNLAACDGPDTNVVTVTLTPRRREQVAAHLDRRGYISQTGCGLCGKTLVDELFQALRPIDDTATVSPEAAEACLRRLDDFQPMRSRNQASHAAVIFDADCRPLVSMEDVGRHNALDKAIGRLFLDRRLHLAKLLVMSSRISYELVQKAARARIPIFMAYSRPTSLAVNLAASLNMTLAGGVKYAGLYFYTQPERFGG